MTKGKEKGFTIIEVALVLAVAALIFLVVFLAVPALQRNQRDDARKRDVSNIIQAVTNATANTNDVITIGVAYPKPATGGSVLKDYLDNMSGNVDFVEVVTGAAATFVTSQPLTPTATTTTTGVQAYTNRIVVHTGVKCKGNVGLEVAAKRSAAVVVQVENGGQGKYYCQDAN
ncbi:MAG: prepilin-type N-terminal cleavage/methylation domain-containing protein [Candidatus Nomurabacteria bacterium]|jgi:prepilin-type N-terminal cleavage/methylation domain-containing protein|nr:prepilin-type N-terminal cleavage/methylation domain-containing protein [Candidatus Nomurabacteria bacterium]